MKMSVRGREIDPLMSDGDFLNLLRLVEEGKLPEYTTIGVRFKGDSLLKKAIHKFLKILGVKKHFPDDPASRFATVRIKEVHFSEK